MNNSYNLSADELEMRVKERTAELEKTNQVLRAEILECKCAENELIRTRDKLEAEIRGTGILHQMSTRHTEDGDFSSILQEMVEAAIEITGADKGSIQVLFPSDGKLRIVTQKGFDHPVLESLESPDLEETAPYRTAVERMESVIVEDIIQYSRLNGSNFLNLLINEGIRSVLFTPLFSRSGDLLGFISVYFGHIHTPAERELILIDILARQAADVIERMRVEEELRENREDLGHAQAVGNIGTWRLNVHQNKLIWSDEVYRIFGVPSGTPLTYDIFLSTVHPDDKEYVIQKWEAGLAGEPYDVEHRIIAEGRIKWVREKANLEFDKDGKLLGGFGITQDITESKRVEEALRQSVQLSRLKLDAILSPGCEIANLKLSEVVDVHAIQSLMDDFYKLAHIPMSLDDLKGNILVGIGWQDICTKFHRMNPEACRHCVESDTKLSAGVPPGEFKQYKCKNNMWDIATPITVGGYHVGNIFSGQFFFEDEPLDYDLFRSQAREYGFNEEEYIAALEKVPRLSPATVKTGMSFFMKFASMISQLSYSNIKLAHSLAEHNALLEALRESEKRERARSDELAAVLDSMPAAVWIAHDPKALQITGNRFSCEWLHTPLDTNFSKSAPEGESPETFMLIRDGVEIPPAEMPLQMSAAGTELNDYEIDIVTSDGRTRHVLGNARPLRDEQGNPRGSVAAFMDITERKRAEQERETTVAFLSLVNESKGTADLVHSAVNFFRERSGLEAVGIRLKEGGDYPYYETCGFPGEFVRKENSLFARDEAGQAICDNNGNPILECMCGNIICGRFDTSKPFFTDRGSFWTNSTSELLNGTTEADRQARTRNRCNGEGYESVALIALKTGEEHLGLLQLNDRRKGQFSPDSIAMWERLADYLAVALAKTRAEEKLHTAYRDLQTQSEELQVKSEDLQEANRALQESEDRFRSVLENSLDAVYRIDLRTWKCDYMSPAIEQITGYSVREMASMSFDELLNHIYHDDRSLVDAELARAINSGTGALDYRFKCKDGQYRWLADRIKVIKDVQGKPLFLGGAVRDITESKQAEETLAFERSQLLSIFDGMDDMVYVADPYTYEVLYANKVMKEKFGGEYVGGTCHRKFQRRDSPCDFCTNPIILKDRGKPYHWEYYNPTVDRHFVIMDRIIRWPDGRDVRLEIAKDITDRKRSEDAIKKSRSILAKSQEMAHVGNWAWNVQTGEINGSDEIYRIYGLGPGDLRLGEDWVMSRVHPDDRALLADFIHSVKMEGMSRSLDYRIIRLNGDTRYVTTVADKIVRDWEGKVKWVYGITQDITERKRVEQELKTSELHLKALVQDLESGVLLIEGDGKFAIYNPAFLRIFNISEQELEDMKIQDLRWDNWNVVDKDGNVLRFESHPVQFSRLNRKPVKNQVIGIRRYPHDDWVWTLASAEPVLNPDGSINFLICTFTDITQLKNAEDAIRLSNLYNRSLIEASLDPLVTIGRKGKITDVNGATEEVTGYSRSELIGTDFSDYFTEPEKARTGYKHVFTDGEVRDYPLEIRHKDGHITPVLYNASVYRDENGEVIGVFAAARDVTEIKKAEEALKKVHDNLEKLVEERTEELEKAYNSLKESEKGLADAQRMAHIGNWRWDITTGEICWSDEVYRIFGLNPQELKVTYDLFFNFVHLEDRNCLIDATKEGLKGNPLDVEYRIILANGEERIVHTKAESISYEENIPVQAKGIIQDITERKKAEKELEKLNRIRIKEIHHRIKNNLQVISSLLDLQAEKLQNKECIEDSEVLEAFEESQNRVLSMSLIHEELYKGEGTDKLNFSAYVQRLVGNLFQAYRVNSRNVRLYMDLEENSFFDMDTAIPLGIIVNELVSNSLKHAFDEGQEGVIQIRLCREAREEETDDGHETLFSLTISDTGRGLPENIELEGHETLGLQLVSILVDQLDGEIEIKREHGTEFRILFNAVERP